MVTRAKREGEVVQVSPPEDRLDQETTYPRYIYVGGAPATVHLGDRVLTVAHGMSIDALSPGDVKGLDNLVPDLFSRHDDAGGAA